MIVLEVYALEIQMYSELKDQRKLKVRLRLSILFRPSHVFWRRADFL